MPSGCHARHGAGLCGENELEAVNDENCEGQTVAWQPGSSACMASPDDKL